MNLRLFKFSTEAFSMLAFWILIAIIALPTYQGSNLALADSGDPDKLLKKLADLDPHRLINFLI